MILAEDLRRGPEALLFGVLAADLLYEKFLVVSVHVMFPPVARL